MFEGSLKTKKLVVIASEERTKQSVIEEIASLHLISPVCRTSRFAMTVYFIEVPFS